MFHKLVKNCCHLMLKHQHLKERLQLVFLLGMCTLNFGTEFCACVSLRNANTHRLQRRFMWKQMDHTMDGLVGGMKNMFGELMPTDKRTTSASSPITDFLPAETTRVKYIIRSPRTNKPLKIIKMRPSKKVIKMQHFPSIEVLRKLEKEQEMIAEGRILPKTSTEIAPITVTHNKSTKYKSPNKEHNNDIFTGKIKELGDDWKPVYEFRESKKSSDFLVTEKPYQISQLHTNIHGESLPKPEKLTHKIHDVLDYSDMSKKRLYEAPKNTYEVTEYIAEESVALPLTQEFHSIHGFLPSTRNAKFQSTAGSSTTTTTTTTEDPPNYPAPFLRKYRERASTQIPQRYSPFKASTADIDTSWIPTTNITHDSSRFKQYPNRNVKAPKWPIEIPSPRPALRTLGTETAAAQTETISDDVRKTIYKNTRSKTVLQNNEAARSRDMKQRGSVKFGDKISLE